MPPPRTSMRFGTKRSSSAAVESQMRGSAGMKPGAMASEPAAMIALAKRTTRDPSCRLDAHGVGGGELALAPDDGHLSLPGEAGEARRQPLDDAVLPAADRREIDRGRPEAHAMRRHRRRLVDGLGDVKHRLRRDAADVEADAAQGRPPVDEDHFLPEVGGAEGGGIAAGTRPQAQEFPPRSRPARPETGAATGAGAEAGGAAEAGAGAAACWPAPPLA